MLRYFVLQQTVLQGKMGLLKLHTQTAKDNGNILMLQIKLVSCGYIQCNIVDQLYHPTLTLSTHSTHTQRHTHIAFIRKKKVARTKKTLCPDPDSSVPQRRMKVQCGSVGEDCEWVGWMAGRSTESWTTPWRADIHLEIAKKKKRLFHTLSASAGLSHLSTQLNFIWKAL